MTIAINCHVAPSVIDFFTLTVLSSTKLHLLWHPPTQSNGVIRQYKVLIMNLNTTQNSLHLLSGGTTFTNISHLHPNHHYELSIAAHTNVTGMYTPPRIISLPQAGTCVCR